MSFSMNRVERLAKAISGAGAQAMYVRDTANIEWLTGFEDVFDTEQAHAVFVPETGEGVKLHTDSRYITAMQREAEGTPIEVDAEVVKMSEWLAGNWSKACQEVGASLAIEDSITLFEYRALEKAFSQGVPNSEQQTKEAEKPENTALPFKETTDLILKLRARKDAQEIKNLKAAQAITDAAFSYICTFIKPGRTEREIQMEIDNYMMLHGAQGLAFTTIVASGANGASPHAIVSEKPVEAGECIVIDFGARCAGYCSDMTRTVFLGQPEGAMLDAWNTMRNANEQVQAMLRPGVTGKEAHELAEKVLADGGFAGRMGHGLGHGVGIQIHELPNLSLRNDKPLEEGNVVTVEPGIYIPGQFGMRLEDFGVVTKNGFEAFTQSTHDIIIL